MLMPEGCFAGLGGGMGPFLMGPLVEELKQTLNPNTPLSDARRVLEVLVPLVYRPALKVPHDPLCIMLISVITPVHFLWIDTHE
jgi:hypothetical protein